MMLSLLFFGVCGCDRHIPTQAEPTAVAAPDTANLSLAAEELSGLATALADARTRILPVLGNGPAADALGSALEELEPALSGTDAAAVQGALGRASAAATRIQTESGSLPDLDVVLLALQQIEELVQNSAGAPSPARDSAAAPDPRREL